MTLKSAFEDLSRTTLRAVLGCLGKLDYLAGLRARQGDYSHWGFQKVHGQATANTTLITAHREAVSTVLSMPLASLLEDVENSSHGNGVDPQQYVEGIARHGVDLLPDKPGPGTARHLNSVLRALSGLVRNRERNATRQAS